MNRDFDIAVIGAGPAGMMAAIFAARNGKRVALLEKNEQIGRKILATGNGRCNLTNRDVNVHRYHTKDKKFAADILAQFDQFKTIKFFEALGLILKEEDRGRIFPRTNQASSVVEVLAQELNKQHIEIFTNFIVKNIAKEEKVWNVDSGNGQKLMASKLIIATGGKAAHHLGSSGDGLFWAAKLGHTLSPIYAALVPVEIIEEWPREVQGVKVEAKVKIEFNNKFVAEGFGDLLFTHFGVSGPAIMSQAGKIAPLIAKGDVKLHIDVFPELESMELDRKMNAIFANAGAKAVKNSLIGIVPANLLPVIIRNAGVDPDKKAAEISKENRQKIVEMIKNMELTVKKIRPLKEAQVTSGGVDLREVDPNTLESKLVPNLYFAGEILDVYGDSGGFNLQWAWSSGYVAGTHRSK